MIANTDDTCSAPIADGLTETADYLEHEGTQIYFVLHAAFEPCRAQVLLAAPFGWSRITSYVPWVRWARFLARQGCEVMRFDYRGVGESGGRFESMAFGSWLADVKFCAQRLKARSAGRPLVLHGMEMGALLASRAFAEGIGDVLLLWSPPLSARELLLDVLRQKMFVDYAARGSPRTTRDSDVKQLESGSPLNVGGHIWSSALWEESKDFHFLCDGRAHKASADTRPSRVVQLDRAQEPLVSGPKRWRLLNALSDDRPCPLNPHLDPWFEKEMEWLNLAMGGKQAS